MNDFALQQPGNRLEANVRMWRHVHGSSGRKMMRTVAVEEAPRPNRPPQPPRQRPQDAQRTEFGFSEPANSECQGKNPSFDNLATQI